jgi:hypothetical protein
VGIAAFFEKRRPAWRDLGLGALPPRLRRSPGVFLPE